MSKSWRKCEVSRSKVGGGRTKGGGPSWKFMAGATMTLREIKAVERRRVHLPDDCLTPSSISIAHFPYPYAKGRLPLATCVSTDGNRRRDFPSRTCRLSICRKAICTTRSRVFEVSLLELSTTMQLFSFSRTVQWTSI